MALRVFFRLWLGVLGLVLMQPAAAAAPDRLADVLALPHAGGLTGARDAPLFAWVENEAGARNAWVGGPGREARKLTAFAQDDGQQLYDLALNRDGSLLAFVRGGDEEFPNQQSLPNPGPEPLAPRQLVSVLPVAGGAAISLGEGHSPTFSPSGASLAFSRDGEVWVWTSGKQAERVARLSGRVERLVWSPDGSRLLAVDDRGEHGFIALLDLRAKRLRYLDPGFGEAVDPVFSPDGRQVAFIRYLSPPAGALRDQGSFWSIRLVDVESGAARSLWAAPSGPGGRYYGTRSRNLFWSDDGLLLFPWERTGWLHVYAIDPRRGGEPRALTAGAFEVETFLLGPDGRSLLYAANADTIDRRHIWRRALSGGAPQRLTSGDGIASFPTIAGKEVAVIATDAKRPPYPALVGRTLSPLGKVAEAGSFAAPEAVTFRAADGIEARGQFFRARGCRQCPAVVYVHGGPRRQMLLGFHPSIYYSKAYAMNQHLAAQGYHVLSVNYRSGTGYGRAFREAPDTGREGASEYRDVLAAGRWLAARSDVDASRIGIWGGSWGGYLTALALARDSDLFAAGANFHGVHSLLRNPSNSISPEAQAKARELQWTSSPLASIESWRSPVLLVHGDDDRNVDFGQSMMLVRELAARGIPYRELVFPNERHTFLRHKNWIESLRATAQFLDDTLMRKRTLP